jgi:hypothetical protein
MEHTTNEAATMPPLGDIDAGPALAADDVTALIVEAGELLTEIEGIPHLAPLVQLLTKLMHATSVMRADQVRHGLQMIAGGAR